VSNSHSKVYAAIKAFAKGEIVVVTDDDDRENEGDLFVAASLCTPEKMAFIIRNTSGIVCAPLSAEEARRLHLDPMVAANDAPLGTAFTERQMDQLWLLAPEPIICFDGDYPELSRITALRGAEVIVRPSALLRSADIWELTNRARAYDNHVYLVGANATGVDPGGVLYFGNSMVVTPVAEVVARAASHECWVSARLDPATAMASLTPGSSVPQVFDHLADRNLELIARYADDLVRPAATSFPHAEPHGEPVD